MPLDYEKLTSEQKFELLTNGHQFLRALCEVADNDVANEVWSQLADIVSPVYKQDLLMHLIVGKLDDVVLTGVGPNVINAIKVVRAYTNLGLKEAKDLVDTARFVGKSKIKLTNPSHRNNMIRELRECGCTVQ